MSMVKSQTSGTFMFRVAFIMVALFLSGVTLRAQSVGNYTFSTSTPGFTSISGTGTIINALDDQDDAMSGAVPIGFTFRYLGVDYTNVYVSSNGYITFNSGTLVLADNTLSGAASGSPRPIIAPLWDDLSAGNSAGGSHVYYASSGGVFTIEWKDWLWDFGAAGAVVSFQLKLNQTTNTIEFVYSQGGTAVHNTTQGASIGLTASAAGSGNFLSVQDAAGSSANTATAVDNISTKPDEGKMFSFVLPSTPTVQCTNIGFANTGASSVDVSWVNGDGAYTVVFAKAIGTGSAAPVDETTYTANASFGNGSQIGATGWYCVYKGSGTGVTVSSLASETQYRFMALSFNGNSGAEKYITSDGSNNPKNVTTTLAAPSTQATNVTYSSVQNTSFTVSWTNGNGDKRAVFIKQGGIDDAVPADNSTYTANTAYASGTQIGVSEWYCIYNGVGTSVPVTGLTPNTAYRVMVCEYNGAAAAEKYKTTSSTNNPNGQTTADDAPTIQATDVVFSSVTLTQMTIGWTRGNGGRYAIFMKAASSGSAAPVNSTSYTGNTAFGSGTQIGSTGWYCVYDGKSSTNSLTVTGLTQGTTYRTMVCEYSYTNSVSKMYNTSDASNNPKNQATLNTPQTQASAVVFSAMTSNTGTVSWTRGNGSACAVFVKATAAGDAAPVDNTTYTANTAMGSGTQIGVTGWYCVYNGAGTSVNLTGLAGSTTYRAMVCEYNNAAADEDYSTVSNCANGSTNNTPTTQAYTITYSSVQFDRMTIGWTRGNGAKCAVFIANVSSGNAAPVNSTTYTANTVFASGTQIGATGWYCVYDNTGISATVTGLVAGEIYRVMVCEYNGDPGSEEYYTVTASNNPRNQTVIGTTWDGAIWNNGDPTSLTDVVINGNYTVGVNDGGVDMSCNKLTVNATKVLTVNATKTLTVANNIVNSGTITLKSGASGNATLVNSGTISGAGTYNVEQYMIGDFSGVLTGRSYYISSPVASATSNVFQPDGTNTKMQCYSEAGGAFVNILDNGTAITPMKGYFARVSGTTTKIFTGGVFNTGSMSDAGLTRRLAGDGLQRGWNLVGNPYPSYLDWDLVHAASTNLLTTIWYRTASGNTPGDMCFDTYNKTGGFGTNNNLGGAVTKQIPPCQAFWVRVDADGHTGTISYTNAMRSHQTGHLLRMSNSTVNLIRLAIIDGARRDEAIVAFNENATDEYEAYDSDKMMGTNSAQCYTSNNAGDMVINTFAPLNGIKSVPVGVVIKTAGTHTFSVGDLSDFETNTTIALEDKITGTYTDLRTNPSYSFTADAGTDNGRFVLHFGLTITDIKNNAPATVSSIYSFEKSVYLNSSSYGNVEVTDMTGRVVISQSVNSGMNILDINNSGVYIIKLINSSETKINKVVIR